MKKRSRTTFEERLHTMIETIRAKITISDYAPDTYIPSILQLSEEFNLSVNSVQKGLDILLKEGLIEKIPRKGIKVVQQNRTTLSVGYYPTLLDELDFSQLIAMFEAKYTNITINLVPLNFIDYVDTAKAYIRNRIVDVVAINHFNFLQFSEKHTDLSTIFSPLKKQEDIYPQLNHAFELNNQLLVQPIVFSPVMLCYNKDMLNKLAIHDLAESRTWGQFIDKVDQIENQTNCNAGFYFYPSTWNRWPVFLLQSGQNFSTLHSDLTAEPVINAIDTCYKLIHRQSTFSLLLSTREHSIEQLFLEQEIPIMVTTYYRLNHLKTASFNFDIAALPYVKEPKSLLLPIGFAINQRSEKGELAQLFIDYLSGTEAQQHIRSHSYSIPAVIKVAETVTETSLKQPDNYTMFIEQLEHMCLLSDLNLSLPQLSQLYDTISLYWSGFVDKQGLIDKLEEISIACE